MCAIVDANVRDEVFGANRPDAGVFFYKWLLKKGKLIVGGSKLWSELGGSRNFDRRLSELQKAGRTKHIPDETVDEEAAQLHKQSQCESDDWHIIALAKLSMARLLYSNDLALHQDFKSIGGRIYSTREYKAVHDSHRQLLKHIECP